MFWGTEDCQISKCQKIHYLKILRRCTFYGKYFYIGTLKIKNIGIITIKNDHKDQAGVDMLLQAAPTLSLLKEMKKEYLLSH